MKRLFLITVCLLSFFLSRALADDYRPPVGIVSGSTRVTGCSDKQVLFNDVSAVGCAASLYWDKVNGRLGIGTTTPQDRLSLFDSAGTTFGLYSSFTDASNYSRLRLFYDTANTRYVLDTQAAGTGTVRPLSIRYNGTEVVRLPDSTKWAVKALASDPVSSTLTLRAGSTGGLVVQDSGAATTWWSIPTTGHLLPGADNTYNIGSATARVANIFGMVVRADTAFNVAGTNGISATLTVRDAGGTLDCNITVTGGIITGSTC